MEEEEIQSAIGVSIGRAQTRLMSPQTPSAEKAAALEGLDGMFDGNTPEDETNEPFIIHDTQGQVDAGPRTPTETQTPSETLPSPWRATPKLFERATSKDETGGPTSILADLNVRRYMASFSLPSMPKTPLFKDFSVPSLGSILDNVRSHSPSRKGSIRNKRSRTVVDTKPDWIPTCDDSRQSQSVQGKAAASRSADDGRACQSQDNGMRFPQIDGASASKTGWADQAGPPMLRRSTSDRSLYLRRVTSTNTSLGDDSRWENVQEQVNTRAKAIRDSLQDSGIKLPSLPGMPSLSSFRRDFARVRAQSDPKPSPDADNLGNYSSHPFLNGTRSQKPQDKNGSDRQLQQPRVPHLDHALDHLTGDLVVMGGYRGSILRSAKPPNRQLWVPVKVGLNIRRVNLEVGLNPEDEESMKDSIFASGMLTHIGPVDMGRRLLKRLQTCKNAQEGRLRVIDYGYDWRLSPHLLSRRLVEFLEKLPCNAHDVPMHERGATVIAHSMGGLITRHAVNHRPELFAGIVYAGVPQHCVNILGPMRNGDEVLLSSKVLTAQVNFTMRSSYLLLPDDGHCFVNKETKEEYPVDFFDVAHWSQYAFSPCISTVLPAPPADKKGILGSLSDSLPSLPMSIRRASTFQPPAADTAANKITSVADPSRTGAIEQQFSQPSRSSRTEVTISKAEALAYLTRTLAEVLLFRRELMHNASHQALNKYPPLATLYANNTPTVAAARVSCREAIRRADAYDDLQFGSGDGVCLAKAAQLPEGYKNAPGGRVRTERGHVGLLGDLDAVGKCLGAVSKARSIGRVGMGV